MLNLLTIMVLSFVFIMVLSFVFFSDELSSKSLLRVAIGAEIKVSSFLSLLIFNVLFLNEPP